MFPSDPQCAICNDAGWLALNVPLQDERFGQIIPCSCKQEELTTKRLARLQSASQLGDLARKTFDSWEVRPGTPQPFSADAAMQLARDYAREPVGWLTLHGAPGLGKTHLAAACVNERLRAMHPAIFMVVPEMFYQIRNTFGEEGEGSTWQLITDLKEVEFLVLDEVNGGRRQPTAWEEDALYLIVNSRYNSRLPTVYTTNKPLTELEERVRSRIMDARLPSRKVEVRK